MEKLNKRGDTRGFNKKNPPKNHPWRKTWVETPQGYQRAVKNGYRPMVQFDYGKQT
jgi:hypothetical protein